MIDTTDLGKEIEGVRNSLGKDLLNELGLPKCIRGHELAAPSIPPALQGAASERDDEQVSLRTNNQLQSRFFSRLPGEVRTLIYTECLGGGIVKFCPVKGQQKGARGAAASSALPLLLSCRKIHHEALNILYSSNTWWLLNSTPFVMQAYLNHAQLNSIRHVVLHYHTQFMALGTNSIQKLEWLGTWQSLSELEGLRTLDVTLYCSDTNHWEMYSRLESSCLRPLTAVTKPRRFSLTLRWPGDKVLGFPPDEVRRIHESRVAEGFYVNLIHSVSDFPHQYCLLGWEEDEKRNPESINECYPLRNQEGMRKGFLRTYRSMPQSSFAGLHERMNVPGR